MICDKCGHETAGKPSRDPWCMYQVRGGKVINKLFDPTQIPDGWYDSPSAAQGAVDEQQIKEIEAVKTPDIEEPKTEEVTNDNSSRLNHLRS